MNKAVFAAIALVPLLAACGGVQQQARPRVAAPPPQASRPLPPPPPPPAQVQHLPGLEGVIGADARQLIGEFGSPRLDVHEGDARKLQFSGAPCVLDVYLYPPDRGAEPRATYVDARRASDGLDVDRASCIAALRQR